MKRILRLAAVVLGLCLGAAAVVVYLDTAPRGGPGDRLFQVSRGENVQQISEKLRQEGFIRSAWLLRVVSRLEGTDGRFKAGYYRIPPASSTVAVQRLLISGEETLEKVTIPEGWTIHKIAALLESHGICSASEFTTAAASPDIAKEFDIPAKSLEGYLYPDTYLVPKPFPARNFAEMMVSNFFAALGELAPEYKNMTRAALHDDVILASIVEREYKLPEEAPLIASVFRNRLKAGIGLESCATLEYIITELQQKAHPEYITLEDERIESPYNTYRWAGLPPGPISNPGKVALDAVVHPTQTDYVYFVLRDPDVGRHYFSTNLNEHNQAKLRFLKK